MVETARTGAVCPIGRSRRGQAELEQKNALLRIELATFKQQLDWFKRQLFGEKSEKRLDIDPAVQGRMFEGLGLKTLPQK
jgi:hypothetical protein